MAENTETATLAAGCFWGVEATFRPVPGVVSTSVGYIGGAGDNPTYEQVCSGNTGHAEAVQVTFDPDQVTYEALLGIFWGTHDPTTVNRQGPDMGTQYRSAVFYHTPEQERCARAMLAQYEAEKQFPRPIVTEIVPASAYWPAEDYHQQYFEKMGGQRHGPF